MAVPRHPRRGATHRAPHLIQSNPSTPYHACTVVPYLVPPYRNIRSRVGSFNDLWIYLCNGTMKLAMPKKIPRSHSPQITTGLGKITLGYYNFQGNVLSGDWWFSPSKFTIKVVTCVVEINKFSSWVFKVLQATFKLEKALKKELSFKFNFYFANYKCPPKCMKNMLVVLVVIENVCECGQNVWNVVNVHSIKMILFL